MASSTTKTATTTTTIVTDSPRRMLDQIMHNMENQPSKSDKVYNNSNDTNNSYSTDSYIKQQPQTQPQYPPHRINHHANHNNNDNHHYNYTHTVCMT